MPYIFVKKKGGYDVLYSCFADKPRESSEGLRFVESIFPRIAS